MSKSKAFVASEPASPTIEAFSFGDAESVLAGGLWDYFEGIYRNGDWYEPPVPMMGLAKSYRMSPWHQSAIKKKINLICDHFLPSRWLSAQTFERWLLDLLQMGNAYLEMVRDSGGRALEYRNAPALHMRVGVEPDTYFWVRPNEMGLGTNPPGAHRFQAGSIVHVFEPDVEQEVYGLPEWISALQSGLLNENATLFRRRYYLNGAHAGFVFYVSEAMGNQDAEAIRKQLSQAKGLGNFKNLFVHSPNGKKDGIQIMPIAEVAAKDEFLGIKNITRDDLLAAHRMPPQLLGVIPQTNGGFGDPRIAGDVWFTQEIGPLMTKIQRELNDKTGLPLVAWKPYTPLTPVGGVNPPAR